MTGPNWPRQRYELIVKKGATPLGIKLHQTKIRRGVYANGFAEGAYPPPGPQACMRVGDILVSVDGKDVVGASLPTALAAIEAARRRDRLRDFITAKQDDHRKGTVILVFERLSPSLTFRDVALDPRKVVYLLNYMLEVRRSTSSTEEVSLDEARLMFWLEVQALFEMSVVMTPSREDMSKVYDKFFRQRSGFYVHELAIKPQTKKGPRKSWDGQLSVTSTPPAVHPKVLAGKEAVESTARQELGSLHLVEDAAASGFMGPVGGANGDAGGARRTRSAVIPPAALISDVRAFDGGGGATEWLSYAEAGGGKTDDDEGFGGSELPDDLLAGDLSKMFRASQEKVEATLTTGAFFRFKTSPWFGRMVAHLSNSPDFVHVPFEKIMAEQELRDVMMLHLVIGQEPGWLQVWREVEMSVKPRLAVLQTRRSVRQRPQAMGNGGQRHRRCTFPGNGEFGRGGNGGGRGGSEGGAGGGLTLSGTVEAKPDAAVAIVASAVYLWDFFLSADSHASLGLARNTNEYTTLQELMVGSSAAMTSGVGAGPGVSADDGVGKLESTTCGLGGGREGSREKVAVTAAAKVAALSAQGGDAGVDLAVSVGKALIDFQRKVLRKLCASIYPEFQASSTYEHLCEELTAGSRSLRRPPAVGLPDTTVPGTPVSPPFSDIAVDPASPSSHWVSTDGPGSPSGIVLPSAPTAPWPSQAPTQVSPRYEGFGAGVFDGPGEERPRSPFIFVGGGEFSARTGDGSPRRNSVPPGPGDLGGDPWSGALAYRSGGQGQESGSAEVPTGLSGPGFEELWNGGRGWVLEKVMRKIEIPSHVSRHRPPFGGTRAKEAVQRLSRSGSGTSLGSASASPELRQHLCLPYKTRRFGRRPYPIVDKALRRQRSGSDPLGPTEDLHIAGGSSTQAGGSQTGELELASPPGMFTQALHAAGGYGVGEDEGRSGFRGGMSGDVVTRWCAEWAVTFSGSLEQGVTKVKMEHAVSVAPREGSSRAVPDGLEAFFWPELPADGRGPCACCSPPCVPTYLGEAGGVKRRGSKSRSRSRRLYSEYCSRGERPPTTPPRVITFAAPGRNGVGTFYGVCLSVYRLVPQWVGELPASPVVFDGHNSSPSPVSPATTMAAVVSAGPAMGLSDVATSVSSGDLCTVHGTARDLSTGVASGEAPAESNAPASGSMTEEERTLCLSAGSEAANSEGNAGGETTGETETVTTSVVETTMSSSLIDLSRLRRGMGIFGKAPLGHNKASPGTAVATRIDSSAGVSSGNGSSTSSASKVDTGGKRLDEPEAIKAPSEETLEPIMGGIATVEKAVDGGAAEGTGITLEVSRDSEAMGTRADGHQDTRKHPSMAPLDTPSRFKMNIGMFGSGKSPAGHRRGRGSSSSAAPASSAPLVASEETGKASKMASNSSTTLAATPAPTAGGGGSGGGLKFASYARRAGNFIGSSESRNNAGRSHKPVASTSSPDVLANGPPAPTPGIPTYLASRAVDLPQRNSMPSPGIPENIGENAAAAAPRDASDPGLVEAAGARGEVGPAAGTSAATTISDAGGMKGRSMSSTTSDSGGFGSSLSDSPKGIRGDESGGVAASMAAGNHRGGNGEGGRQLHVYYVPSGVCLLSTRPEIGAMRRSIAAYWSAHADEITASVVAAEGEATEGDDLGGFQDTQAAFPGPSVGAWTRFTADELRDALTPFVMRQEPEKRQEQRHHDHQCHRHQRQVSEAAAAVTSINLLPKSYSVGDMTATANLAAGSSGLDGDEGAATLLGEPNVRVQRHRPEPSGAERAGGLEAGLDFDPSAVFRCLSPRHLCLVVTALLCERKVVVVSSRLSLLTMAGEVFRSLLQPLSWSHVYVPLLPRRMAGDLLQCPTPYLLGLDSETASGLELPKDAMQIYLDVDVLLSPKDFVGLAPMSILCARLSSVWNPGVDDLDYPLVEEGACAGAVSGTWSARTAGDIISLFREFVSELLQGAAECTFEVGQGSTLTVLLDERLYKHAKAAAAKEAERFYEEERRLSPWGRRRGREAALSDEAGPLYNRHCSVLLEQFVKTQMLSQFLSEGTWL